MPTTAAASSSSTPLEPITPKSLPEVSLELEAAIDNVRQLQLELRRGLALELAGAELRAEGLKNVDQFAGSLMLVIEDLQIGVRAQRRRLAQVLRG